MGQLVFKSNGNYFGNEWDGTYNGEPLPLQYITTMILYMKMAQHIMVV